MKNFIFTLILALFMVGCGSDADEKALGEFMDKVTKGDTKAAAKYIEFYNFFNNEEDKESVKLSILKRLSADVLETTQTAKENGGVRKITIVKIDTDTYEDEYESLLRTTIRFNNGSKQSYHCIMVNIDGKWYIRYKKEIQGNKLHANSYTTYR